jgi:sugar phosphate isomerase/epimerase
MEKRVALALYSVRDAFAADTHKTLKAVKEMGYSAVEFAGLAGKSAQDIRAQLDELGLRGLSAHVPLQRQQDDLSGVIREMKTLGLEYLVCPWLPPEQRTPQFFGDLAPILKKIAQACVDEGLVYCYHNHDFELVPTFGNRNVLEHFAQQIDPKLLQFELDLYWVKFAGLDPVKVLEQFAGRVPLIHLKDMSKDSERTFTEVGSGSLDMAAILKTAEQIGARWGIVEQDRSKGDPLESVASSLGYLKTQGME